MKPTLLVKAGFILAAISVILAGLALIGWAWDFAPIKHGLASSVAMNPASAVCLILLALETARLNMQDGHAVLSRARQLAVIAVIAVSAMKLGDLILGSSFAIDQFIFRAKLDAEPDFPSRMAPNTAAR